MAARSTTDLGHVAGVVARQRLQVLRSHDVIIEVPQARLEQNLDRVGQRVDRTELAEAAEAIDVAVTERSRKHLARAVSKFACVRHSDLGSAAPGIGRVESSRRAAVAEFMPSAHRA